MEIGPVFDGNLEAEPSSNRGYIQHHVSKLDTLPGIAIKYGVEVADIKRLNGLATDFQMFARKTLQIPLPGRHPPSNSRMDTSISDKPRCTNSEPRPRLGNRFYPSFYTATKETHRSALSHFDAQNIERRNVTSAMGLLQGYYGLSTSRHSDCDGTEMLLYRSDADVHSEEEPFTPPRVSRAPKSKKFSFLNSASPQNSGWVSHQGKCEQRDEASTSLAVENGSSSSNMHSHNMNHARDSGVPELDRSSEKVFRRRTKVEGGDNNEVNAWQDSGPGDSALTAGKAPRPKTYRTGLETESEVSPVRLLPFAWASSGGTPTMETGSESKGLGGVLLGGMARSASTSNLQDEKNVSQGNSAYKSGTKELLDAPSQGPMLSITRPFLEGLVKPSNRRNKAALD
ncbi:hypothetical protein O6H91_18G046700 [Diphasiastrum complanatum]|uniref:Uncharacterized protein n=1 Tax=Diphasiastrum complanatum TaxID=34168 RepID=A0ACC2B0M2_DIPCM|nr:hypothetical protein O6H91_Y049500 [Diphasiastrum complanatum]KAJ7523321.1 hypothetical protein O6H91_18G046700 [Diphasiastrum complanatum]